MLQVTSIEHLKQLSNINGRAEFYMLLVGGLCRSSKEIHYDEQTKRFDIYNEIDDTYQSNLKEKALHTKTNIPEAIKNGVFNYHSSTPPKPYISKLSYFYKGMTTKEQILTKLKANKPEFSKFGISDIGLFGSYLHDQQTPNSDIDLLIDFEPGKENFDNLMAAYDLFENIFIGEKVEVLTKNGLSKYIGPQILQNIVYV